RRHRFADHPEKGEPALLAHARPVRQRDFDQRRQRFPRRFEGPLSRAPARRRPSIGEQHLSGAAADRGQIKNEDASALSALNMRLRDDYVTDCNVGVGRWNKVIAEIGIPFEIKLPHVAFHRHIGEFSNIHADVGGRMLSEAEWDKKRGDFLPSDGDKDFIESLMQPQFEPAKFASWIAPPKLGIDNKPGDFEYVKIANA